MFRNSIILGTNNSLETCLIEGYTIGGSKYRGKQYGGMIVFQSYNTDNLIKSIKELQNE